MNEYTDVPMIVRSTGAKKILRANKTFGERLGLKADDLIQHPLADWIHPDDQALLEAGIAARTGRVTARHRTKEGGWLEFDWRIRPYGEACAVLGRLMDPSTKDSTTRTAPTTQHATLNQTLEAMARVVESRNPGFRCSILLVDPETDHITVGAGPSLPQAYNDAVEGLKIGPLVGSCGTAAFWNVPVVVEDIAADPLWADLRGAAAIAGVASCWSHPVTATDGKVLGATALYYRSPRAPTGDQMHGLEIAARMIGLAIERDSLETQLLQAAKMKALGVLAGGIAHDFNNLLAVISGNAELAIETLPPDSSATGLLADIVSAGHSAGDLCNQMLAYAGKTIVSAEVTDCNALVTDLGGLLQVALSKKATLRYNLTDASSTVLVDRAQFRQIVMNLITNASEALGDEPGEITISTSVHRYGPEAVELVCLDDRLEAGDYVALRISDTGAGMNADTQNRIFDPYFSTKSQGRGLGLAAVQGIVMKHGGTIFLASSEAQGTTFTVLLPLAKEIPENISEPETPPREALGSHVLVVDDVPLVRDVLTKILEHGGYTVTSASDGREAVDIFRKNSDEIDCVMLDLSMPILSGVEALEEFREIRSNIPVVLCSGYSEQEILTQFDSTGPTYAMQKMPSMNVVIEKVSNALQAAQASMPPTPEIA